MAKPPITDAEFEVVHDPRRMPVVARKRRGFWDVLKNGPDPIVWNPQPFTLPKGGGVLTVIRWTYVAVMVGAALLTMAVGLTGGDLDTTHDHAARPPSIEDPLPIPPVTPAPTSAGRGRW